METKKETYLKISRGSTAVFFIILVFCVAFYITLLCNIKVLSNIFNELFVIVLGFNFTLFLLMWFFLRLSGNYKAIKDLNCETKVNEDNKHLYMHTNDINCDCSIVIKKGKE